MKVPTHTGLVEHRLCADSHCEVCEKVPLILREAIVGIQTDLRALSRPTVIVDPLPCGHLNRRKVTVMRRYGFALGPKTERTTTHEQCVACEAFLD